MLFYLVRTPQGELVPSPFPELDKPYVQGTGNRQGAVRVLSPGIPLAYLEPALARVSAGVEARTNVQVEELILSILDRQEELRKLPWHWEDLNNPEGSDSSWSSGRSGGSKGCKRRGDEESPVGPGKTERHGAKAPTAEIMSSLSGRKLTEDELGLLAGAYGLKAEAVWQLAHFLVRAGRGEWVPAVRREGALWRCQRCGESELEEWPSVYGQSFTCPSCRSLGTCSSLKVIYRDLRAAAGGDSGLHFPAQEDETGSLENSSGLILTPAQERAAAQVLEFVQNPLTSETLLWAACGAGKTEVCFPAAAWALAQGKAVLFAAPRQDVVHDVAPRLRQAFPDLAIPVLSGASAAKFDAGRMVLATTHQVLRFYQAFDLIFLDELDAFPYRDNRMLQWGITQALRPGGKTLFLSATPDQAMRKRMGKPGKIIRLPARHHRQPLPVPRYEKIPDWSKFKEPAAVLRMMQPGLGDGLAALRRQGPVLFFVPKISWVRIWIDLLGRIFPPWRIEGSYSCDPARQDKLAGLRRGEFDLFVATSILERGVTIEAAQVAVMAADHPVFDERALVQMAGRAGRTRAHPNGEVIFFAARETGAIKTAVGWINEQNDIARSAGLLD